MIPPHKSPGAMAFIQHQGRHPEKQHSPLCWVSDMIQFKNDWINCIPLLSLCLPFSHPNVHAHACTRTHANTFLLSHWAGMRRGNFTAQTALEGIPAMKLGPLSPVFRKDTTLFFSSANLADDLNRPATYVSTLQLCPLTLFSPTEPVPFPQTHQSSFLPQPLLWWEHPLPSKSQLGWHFSDPPGWWLRCPCYVLLWGAYLSHPDCNLSPQSSCKSWDTELSLSCSQTCIKVG